MEEGTADGRQQRSGAHDAVGRRADAMIEDENSQRVQEEPVERAGIVAGDDDQIESSLISEFGAQNPDAMGSSFQQNSEAGMDEASNHLFTDAMKLQLRAQILVLGDLLKGIAPNPDWLEDACLESAIGAESVLLSPNDVPRGTQDVRCENTCIDDGVPAESNLQRISPPFGAADLPATRDAAKDELLHSAGRRLSAPGEPSSSGKELSFRGASLAQEAGVAPSRGQLLITCNHTPTARLSHPNGAEEDSQEGTENRMLESDKHLDLAQASAQDALTTATSALAQSHMVWARLHSQDHSEEGIARDARLASVAATVAAASSVAKAAVEAARAIAEVSMDAFIQAGGYQLGEIGARTTLPFGSTRSRPLQVDCWEPSSYSNARENGTPSQQRAEVLESVVQAAGKAAEAATQAGAVLAKANPMIQNAGLSGFWSARKPDEVDVEQEGNEGNENYNETNEANEMDAADEVDGFDGEVGALNETNELDGANEEDVVEEKEDTQEEEDATCRDELDSLNGDKVAAANGDEMVTAIGDEVVAANGDEVAAVNEVAVANEDGVFGGANEVAEPFETEKRISPRSRKFKRGRGRSQGASSRAKRSKISSPPSPAQIPENAMHENADVFEGLKGVRDGNARGKKRGAKHMETTPGEDTPATAPPAQDPDNAVPEIVEVLESQKNVRDRNSRAQRRGTQSPEDEMHKQDDALKSQKNVRGKKRGSKQIENAPLKGDIPATAPAPSPDNEVQKQDDAVKSPKNVRGKKRGAKHIEITPVREDTPATALAQNPENEVHKQDDDALKSQKNVRGKKRGAKHIENAPVMGDTPATAPAQSVENELHKQDDAQTGRKNARGKKRAAKQIETAPVSTSGEDVPATTALVQSPENEVHKKDDALKSRKNVRGKKRDAKHVESTPVSTSGEDVLATALVQSPENEVHKKDDVPKSRKNVRGRTRGAKTLSTPGKDIADRHSRGAETDEIPGSCSILEGSAVEVMIDEVGLRGGWFSGTVLRMIPDEVFVELHDLLTDDGKAHVREWFPLVEGFNPHHPRRYARPVHPFTIFNEAGSRKRRRVALGSQTWHMGDQVDAFVQDAWWEGIVAEMNDLDPTKATIYFPEENDTQLVKTWDLRPSFQWKDNQWIPWKSPALVEDERPQKRPKPGDPNKDGPDELTSPNDKSSEGRAEGSRIILQEDVRTMPEQQQESKTLFQRSKWKKSNKKKNVIRSQEERNPNNGPEAHQTTDVLAPGTSKKLDFTMDDATVVPATTSAPKINRGKAPLKKGKPTRRRKRYT